MVYWRGVKAALAVRRDSFKRIGLTEEASEHVPRGESGGIGPLGLQETLEGLCRPQAAAGGKVISWLTAWGAAVGKVARNA